MGPPIVSCCQLVLLYFFLAKKNDLSWLQRFVLKKSSAALLPHVPPEVNNYAVECFPLVFINLGATLTPV
jgi:hypothetical protein